MKKTKNWLLIGLFAVVMLGCASADGPPFELKPAVPDKATIYAFRTASIVGGGNSDLVAVNGRFIGRIDSGTYAVYVTDPGSQRISRKAGSIFFGEGEDSGWGLGAVVGALDGYIDLFEIDARPGQIYFVRFSQGELVSNDEALGMMDGLENVTPAEK